ncbi:hypothetical protein B0A49_10041 [Cryomyces minteri]|uniref:DUF2306 domain-containing protein n=1 Tax=Cryomyces minteri TaxID=331657 RepID=A0A4U0X037_9PEZI|nr:hypothetical protein B0A49_10041 [Cryomyces minteri]
MDRRASPYQSNAWVRFWRKVYHPLGFNKGYNFPLFIVFVGALLGFILARFQYLNIDGIFAKSAAPGEWYWYGRDHYRIGIIMHLSAIIPAGFLVCFQFVPVLRHMSCCALMIARRAFGGELATQTGVGLLAIITTLGVSMAYYNIKRLQIDQHRAWMLRTWFYAGSIITLRLILIISAHIISSIGSYYLAVPCDEIDFISGPGTAYSTYQSCLAGDSVAAVHANFSNKTGNVEKIRASLDVSFGMALWLALFLHAFGVEIYLQLTPAESERLRRVSYERQFEAGFEHPGSAGLTVDRWGDAEAWAPPSGGAVDIVSNTGSVAAPELEGIVTNLTVDAIASFTSVAEPTIASSVAGIPDIDANAQDLLEDSTEESDYTGIEWNRLPQYHKPHHGFKDTPSWVWKYGYQLRKGKKIY